MMRKALVEGSTTAMGTSVSANPRDEGISLTLGMMSRVADGCRVEVPGGESTSCSLSILPTPPVGLGVDLKSVISKKHAVAVAATAQPPRAHSTQRRVALLR